MPLLQTPAHIRPIPSPLPTCIPSLSLPRGSLTEIYGASATGKTQLLLTFANHAQTHGNVLLLDTEGGIEPLRIAQIHVSTLSTSTAHNTRLLRLHTFHDLTVLLHVLPHIIDSINGAVFIGIDSLTTVFRTLRAADAPRRLEALALRLRQLAIEHDVAVVVTNHARVEHGRVNSAMGESWRYVCGMRLCTKIVGGDRIVSVVKSLIAHDDVPIRITSAGVVDS